MFTWFLNALRYINMIKLIYFHIIETSVNFNHVAVNVVVYLTYLHKVFYDKS